MSVNSPIGTSKARVPLVAASATAIGQPSAPLSARSPRSVSRVFQSSAQQACHAARTSPTPLATASRVPIHGVPVNPAGSPTPASFQVRHSLPVRASGGVPMTRPVAHSAQGQAVPLISPRVPSSPSREPPPKGMATAVSGDMGCTRMLSSPSERPQDPNRGGSLHRAVSGSPGSGQSSAPFPHRMPVFSPRRRQDDELSTNHGSAGPSRQVTLSSQPSDFASREQPATPVRRWSPGPAGSKQMERVLSPGSSNVKVLVRKPTMGNDGSSNIDSTSTLEETQRISPRMQIFPGRAASQPHNLEHRIAAASDWGSIDSASTVVAAPTARDASQPSEASFRRLQAALAAEQARNAELVRLRSESFAANSHVMQLEARLAAESERSAKLQRDIDCVVSRLRAVAANTNNEIDHSDANEQARQQQQAWKMPGPLPEQQHHHHHHLSEPLPQHELQPEQSWLEEQQRLQAEDVEVKLGGLLTNFNSLTAKLSSQEKRTATLQKQFETAEAQHEEEATKLRAMVSFLKSQLEEQSAEHGAQLAMMKEKCVKEEAQCTALRKQLAAADSQGEEERARLRKAMEATELERAMLGEKNSTLQAELENLRGLYNERCPEDKTSTDLSIDLKRELQEVVAARDALQANLTRERSQSSELREKLAMAEAQLTVDGAVTSNPLAAAANAAGGMRSHVLNAGPRIPTPHKLVNVEMFHAAEQGNLAALQAALQTEEDAVGCILQSKDAEGRNLLHVAILSDQPGARDVVFYLLMEGQRWAARQQFIHSLQGVLWQRDAYKFICGCDSNGATPLVLLCRQTRCEGQADIAMSMLEAFADPLQHDGTGMTPFLECTRSANVELMQLLFHATHGVVLNDLDGSCQTALHWAVSAGNVAGVKFLIEARANLEAGDLNGSTALAVAQESGNEEIIEMLSLALDRLSEGGGFHEELEVTVEVEVPVLN